jgi:hypothetical protein
MPLVEGVAIGRLHKPAEFSIRRRPEHEIERHLAGNFRAAACCVGPLRSDTEHELDLVGQRERFLEQKIGAPLGVTGAKQGRDTRLDFQPILDRGELDRDRGTKARGPVRRTPFACPSDFNIADGYLSSA